MSTQTEFYKAKEVAAKLNVSMALVYKMARNNEIPHAKFSDSYRFPKAIIDQWIEGLCQSSLNTIMENTTSTMPTEQDGVASFQRGLANAL